MAITGQSTLKVSLSGTVKDSDTSGTGAKRTGNVNLSDISVAISSATTKSVFRKNGTLSAGVAVDIDLDGASITDLNGDSITFDSINYMLLINEGITNAIDIVKGNLVGLTTEYETIEPSSSAGANDGLRLWSFGSGRSIVGTTADTLTIESTTGTDYILIVAGTKD